MLENNKRGGYKDKMKTTSVLVQSKPTYQVQDVDIFGSLALEKRAKMQRLREKQALTPAPSNSKAGKLQTNGNFQSQNQNGYQLRKSRGVQRVIYNEGVKQIPGVYNLDAKVDVQLLGEPTNPYQFLNMTSNARTQALQDHFEQTEEVLKK